MTNLFKTTVRVLSVVVLCSAMCACSQSGTGGSFPAYGSPTVTSSASASSIMDY